jgi:hypothetical protein
MLGIGLGIPEADGLGEGQSSETMSLLRATVDRNSTRTVQGFASDAELADGQVLLTVPVDIPALEGFRLGGTTWFSTDINGLALPTEGLSVADAAENLLLRSEEFDSSVWAKGTGGSISADSVKAPNGLMTADAYTWAVSTSTFAFLAQGGSGDLSTDHTFSVYLKTPSGDGSKTVKLSVSDLSISTVKSTSMLVTENWTRLSFTVNTGNNTGLVGAGFSPDSFAAGDIMHVWGAQLEVGPVATPYIPTTTTTETRDADLWSEPTPSVLTPQKGAIEMVIDPSVTGQAAIVLASFVDSSNYISVGVIATSVNFRKLLAGVPSQPQASYTHTSGTQMLIQVFWDNILGMGVRAADESVDITAIAFDTNSDIQDTPLASTVTIGNRDGALIFQGTYKAPIFYASKAAAGW